MPDVKKRQSLLYTLNKKSFATLIIFFILLLLGGIAISVYVLAKKDILLDNNMILWVAIASIGGCVSLCSMQYIHVLYKIAIRGQIVAPQKGEYAHIGNILYFVTRPLFAIVFSMFVIFGILGGLIVITSSLTYVINERFLYLSYSLSCFIGFSVGKVLERFTVFSERRVKESIKTDDENDKE